SHITGQAVVLDEDLEGALAVAVVIPGAGRVKAHRVLVRGDVEDLGGRNVEDLRTGVDELADQPGAGDPVGLGPGAGNPFHDVSCWSAGAGAAARPGWLR